MLTETYKLAEEYMKTCMQDSAHDVQHIYRVLYAAMEIADYEPEVDYEILITACLLHDIGRKEQFENPGLCHAAVGGEKAYDFLMENGWSRNRAEHVRQCITSHRFRTDNQPESVEAKIVFDADKLDVTGALGIARTFLYKGEVGEPIYTLKEDQSLYLGSSSDQPSFLQEYKKKLEGLYERFYTEHGRKLACERQAAAVGFYDSIVREIQNSCEMGQARMKDILENR